MRTLHVTCLHSEMALSWEPFGIGHVYMHTILLRITDTMISQNIDLYFWTPCISFVLSCLLIGLEVGEYVASRNLSVELEI